MKTLNINIRERLGIATLLDKTYQKGGLDLRNLVIAQKILGLLMIDEKEQKDVKWTRTPDGNINWDTRKDKGKNIEFSDDAIKLITEIIKRRNDSKEFTLADSFLVELTDKLEIKI